MTRKGSKTLLMDLPASADAGLSIRGHARESALANVFAFWLLQTSYSNAEHPARCGMQIATSRLVTFVIRLNRIYIVIALAMLGIAGCGGGLPNPAAPSYNVSVSPSSVTVAAGSTTTFTASFTPSRPEGGSLTWSVKSPTGGTITDAGAYTASGTVGNYMVVATWTPSNPVPGAIVSASAAVDVLPPPQLGAELNPDLIQASGAIQVSGAIQNVAVVGQLVPSVISTDPNNSVEVLSGFTVPISAACPKSDKSCSSSTQR